jgi:LacI family transcriptional regulator
LEELRLLVSPFVLIDRELPADLGGSAILYDVAGGIESTARHLRSLGHRRIGLLAGPDGLRPGREAARGMREFCAGHPEVTCVIEHGAFSSQFGENAASRILTSAERPTAVIAGGYQILLGVLGAMRAFGLRAPDDVSLVAFDDVESLEFFDPPIAALSREPVAIGEQAAELLLARIHGRHPDPVIVSTVFRPRRSCGPPHA